MQIKLKRDSEFTELQQVVVKINTTEFRIYVNKFDELVINKNELGEGSGSLLITPNVSNQIFIK